MSAPFVAVGIGAGMYVAAQFVRRATGWEYLAGMLAASGLILVGIVLGRA